MFTFKNRSAYNWNQRERFVNNRSRNRLLSRCNSLSSATNFFNSLDRILWKSTSFHSILRIYNVKQNISTKTYTTNQSEMLHFKKYVINFYYEIHTLKSFLVRNALPVFCSSSSSLVHCIQTKLHQHTKLGN